MKKSYAKRIMVSCSAILLASMLILDSVLIMFVWQEFKQEKYDLLEENVSMVSETIRKYIDDDHELDADSFEPLLYVLSAAIDANLIVADQNGGFLLDVSGGRNDGFAIFGGNDQLPALVKQELDDKHEFYDSGKLGGLYQIRCYSYAKTITDATGQQVGYVIASIPMQIHRDNFILKMFKLCLAATIPVLLLSCIVCYGVAGQIAKPLRLAADAASKFGRGDFTTRLPVDSEDEIGVLMREMNTMAQSLAATDSIQRSFVANVSHELKTPMTTISGFVDGILDGTIPESKQRHYLQLVSEEVKRLSRLVRTMLNLSKIEEGQMQPNKTDFNILETVIQVVLSFESRIEEHKIEVRGLDMEPVYVNADEDLVHQVMYNLIENAVKFTNENGYIAFDIYCKESRVYVAVQNSGLGLSKEELENVFKRFYKSDRSRGKDKTGFGLGLYIVRSIVAIHGGEVEVESIEGEYCRFTVSFDQAKEAIPVRSRQRGSMGK